MTQEERLNYMIEYLIREDSQYEALSIPKTEQKKKRLLRSLMNVRSPKTISHEFLKIQDLYLQEENTKYSITSIEDLVPMKKGLYLWQGDITKLKVDGIVNAGNDALLGCFLPCHGCIDNAIHSSAGIQLRLECQRIMEKQGIPEATGKAKITKAYNLPSLYVLHTVGPIINGRLSEKDCFQLSSCYRSCLELAESYKLKSIAFCCISTGEFHFPNDIAGQIAVDTVMKHLKETDSEMEVVFNVFKDKDWEIYKGLLG